MKRIIITSGYVIILSITSLSAQASLVTGSTLSIESGSYFDLFGQTSISGIDGLIIGSTQAHDFSFTGDRIDEFVFLGIAGMHYTTSPTNVLTSAGNSAAIDFSGWSWAFNANLANINLGTGSWGSNPEGIAEITCGIDCGNGDTYSLMYTATVPDNDPNGYAGFTYELYLTGNVSAVPIPAAVWLFSSGLLGIFGVGARKYN